MIAYVHGLIILAAMFVYLRIPPSVPCKSSTEVPPTCPPGPDGIAKQGPDGEDGLDCFLTTFPNKQVGCLYSDNSESIIDPTMEKYFSRISPERFTRTITIILVSSCAIGFGLWMQSSGIGGRVLGQAVKMVWPK